MNILVADSGGTKTDWYMIDGQGDGFYLRTSGFSPNIISPAIMVSILRREVMPWLGGQCPDLHFFGAGLGHDHQRRTIAHLLARELPRLNIAKVGTDLEGAALACLGDRSGVVGILGTGSAAFAYDGRRVSVRRGGWGYLLGDEGGGSAMGREILRLWLDGGLSEAPSHALSELLASEPVGVPMLVHTHPRPAEYFASLVPILERFQQEPEILAILLHQFQKFFDRDLLPLCSSGKNRPVLLGGITKSFANILRQVGRSRNLEPDFLEESPAQAIARYLHAKVRLPN